MICNMIHRCFLCIVYLVFRDENVDIRVQLPHVAQEHCQLKIAKTGEVTFFCDIACMMKQKIFF